MFQSETSSPMLRWFRRHVGVGGGMDGKAEGPGMGTGAEEEAGEETPLLRRTGDGTPGQQDAAFKERIVSATAAFSFVASCLSILIDLATSNRSVILSGIFGCLLSPYSIMQQKKLTQIEALEQTNELMESEIDELSRENARLAANVRQLEESVKDLPAMEEALGIIQSLQGRCSLAQLQEDLDAHHARWASDKDNDVVRLTRIRGEVIRRIVRAMDAGDRTGAAITAATTSTALMLSDAEIDSLISAMEGVRGVRVQPVLVRDCIVEHGRSIVGLAHVMKQLLRDDSTESSSEMFRFAPQS